ncbi:peptidylprolyl isomerase [Salipaludibacillus keqinensis]|uniref:Peptidyl-prolyl cis-trans isomerase n=1 Tax=Salipaludibacillus keqinensis TaxID=2045207 RepID=A0A323TNJ0_9BACI|nr:peptidylprolyl isomerase [Salipaludibacillus keqinensis]PYZ95247.1 peptidylprolyl isomerase [Salipaludibacillus keqinensis]
MKKSTKYLASLGISTLVILSACGDNNDNNENQEMNEETTEQTDVNNEQSDENNQSSENNETAMDEETPSRDETPDDYPQFNDEVAEDEREAIISTNMGDIHIKLFPEVAPKAVENFLTLAEEGYYEEVIFHRVIENFMIQGGDPTGTGSGGESAFGGSFEDEFDTSVAHFQGALSMANSGPNTNGSQFFIVHADSEGLNEEAFEGMASQGMTFPEETVEKYLEVGGTPHLDFGHTVFGHVIGGMDVVNEIATVETEPVDRPVDEVYIESVEVID